jgi:hypothetical protein
MTVQEYEERFRSSIPSLHQTFVAADGPNQARCRSRRFWVAAALLGAVTMTCKLSLHHAVQSETVNDSQIWHGSVRCPASALLRGETVIRL